MQEKSEQGWYFGWTIVAAATLLTLLTVGMRLGIGPFFLPMVNDLGFSRSLLASIVAVPGVIERSGRSCWARAKD